MSQIFLKSFLGNFFTITISNIYRFKVPIYVTDLSETIQVFLFDREVRRLTLINVSSLIGQNIKVILNIISNNDYKVLKILYVNYNIRIYFNIFITPLKEGKRHKYPEKLKAIAGKKLTLTISLNEKNLVHGNMVYFASYLVEEVPTLSQISEITSYGVDFRNGKQNNFNYNN